MTGMNISTLQPQETRFTAGTKPLMFSRPENSCDLAGKVATPSNRRHALMMALGLGMVISGPSIFLLNIGNQGWAWAFALITSWLGMTLLLLLWNAGCRNSASGETRSEMLSPPPQPTCTSHLSPMAATLAELASQTHSRTVVLLSAEEAIWQLRLAWNCSQTFGKQVAHLLAGRVQSEAQSHLYLSLMDGSVSTFCTPIHLRSGKSLLLVLVNEMNHTMLYNTPSLCFQASLKIVDQIANSKLQDTDNHRAMAPRTSEETMCCSVCDSVSTPDGRWIHWGEWLTETHNTNRAHSFCDGCSQWIYGLNREAVQAS